MKAKLTKKQALIICRDLWTWMRDNGMDDDEGKNFWAGWKNVTNIDTTDTTCPCCEYHNQHKHHCGQDCLLSAIWPNGCITEPSVYLSFFEEVGTPEDAQKIIDACNKELEKLGEKQ